MNTDDLYLGFFEVEYCTSGCQAHLYYRRFMRSNKQHAAIVLHTEQILTHYPMIDQLSASTDSRHQMTLEASLGLAP